MRQPVRFGKYLLLDRIAVGGMAEVFAAKAFGAEGFERILAIKKILPTLGEDPEFVSMFVDEARIAVQLSHANIVQVLELGKHDESLYIAMEYVSGRDLRQLLDRYRRDGQPMPVPQACAIAARVCEALDYAHRKQDVSGNALGIVHRDVSPQNVLVSFDGDVKLIDFGIAKAERRVQRTQSGILKGKFSYMSPEQVRGQPVDRRSDVFAAGVLLWELLCGRKLFTGESDYAVLEKVRKGEVPHPSTVNPRVPQALAKVTLAALAPEPRDRFQWCSELHDALAPFAQAGGAPVGSRRLAEWMREEFRSDYEKEQARMRRWLGIADQDRTSPDARPARASAGGMAVAAVEDARRTDGWRVAPDADTLVRPPTPTGRTRPGNGTEPPAEQQQPTRMLRPGDAGQAAFDSSGDPTAARRTERRAALTRPRTRGRPRTRLLGFALALVAITAAAGVYFAVGRAPPPRKQERPVAAAAPAPEVAVVATAPPEEAPTPVAAPAISEKQRPARASRRRAPVQPERREVASTAAEDAAASATPATAEPRDAPPGPEAPAEKKLFFSGANVPGEARLHVLSEPIGAEIRLAGKSLGRAPLTTEPLQPDQDYELTATLEGYVSVRRSVRAGSGTTDVTLMLPIQSVAGAEAARGDTVAQPASAVLGYLVTSTRPVARIAIDGRETGRWTPVPEANPIALPAGAHTIAFETADGKRYEETLQIEPGKTARLVREIPR